MCLFLVTFPLLTVLLLTEKQLIPSRIAALVRNGIVRLRNRQERRLCEFWRRRYRTVNVVAQILGGFVGLVLFYVNLLAAEQAGSWQAAGGDRIVAGWACFFWIGVFYAVVTVYVFRAVTTAAFLRSVAGGRRVRPVPFHVDNCGGLRPIGAIGLRNQYILAAAGINVVFLIVLVRFIQPNPFVYPFLVGSFVLYAVAGPTAFLGPLLPFRKAMRANRQWLVAAVATALQKHYDTCIRRLGEGGELVAEDEAKAERLRKFLAIVRRAPVWPFDIATLRRFATAYVFPIAGLLGLPLWNKLIDYVMP